MRVLHVLDHSLPLQSGYTYRTISIFRRQRALGWEPVALTSPKHIAPGPEREEIEGFIFHRTPPLPARLAATPVLAEIALMRAVRDRLLKLVDEVRPHVIHAHSPALNGLPAVLVGRARGIPVVYEMRAVWEDAAVDHGRAKAWGPRYRAARMLENLVLRSADAVTTICEGLRREVLARGIPPEKVTVIPNGVDPDRFPPIRREEGPLARELGLAGALVLGFIGSFYAYEGLRLLVEALPQIRAQRPNVKLLLVGGGPDEPAIRRLVAESGVADNVALAGRVPQAEVTRYYGLVDLMVYPRLPMRLTELVTPLKPLESMALKQVSLASDVGGHRELIRDGETGYLFSAGRRDALAARVNEVLDRREEWPRIREAGRRFVESERSWAASVERYRGVYEPLLGRAA